MPIKNYKMRTKKESLGHAWDEDLNERVMARTRLHYEAGAERIELYRDPMGTHLEATYKEETP